MGHTPVIHSTRSQSSQFGVDFSDFRTWLPLCSFVSLVVKAFEFPLSAMSRDDGDLGDPSIFPHFTKNAIDLKYFMVSFVDFARPDC